MMEEIHIIRKRHLRALRIFRGKNHNSNMENTRVLLDSAHE